MPAATAVERGTLEDIVGALKQKAAQDGDRWRLKISRKQIPSGSPMLVAVLDDATLTHITNPEIWLPRLAGGGPYYVIQPYHQDDPNSIVGGIITLHVAGDRLVGPTVDEASGVDFAALRSADWQGPRKLMYPDEKKRTTAQPHLAFASPAPSSTPAVPGAPVTPAAATQQAIEAQLLLERTRQENETLRDQLRRLSVAAEEQAHRHELERLQAQYEARAKEVEARQAAQLAEIRAALQQQQTPKGPGIEAILSTLAPVLQQLFAAQNESRMQMLKLQSDQASQTQALMLKLFERPAIDPVMEKMLDRMENSRAEPASEMVTHMAEAMGALTRTTMDLVHTAAGLNDPQESPVITAIREGVKGIESIASGYQRSIELQSKARARARERQAPPPPPPPARKMASKSRSAEKNDEWKRQREMQQRVQAREEPAPVVTHETVQPPKAEALIDEIERRIRAHDNAADVAARFIDNVDDPSVVAALDGAGGTIFGLMQARFGPEWLQDPKNTPYLQELLAHVQEEALTAGIIQVPGVDAGPEDEEPDEELEDEDDVGEDDEEEDAEYTEEADDDDDDDE